MLIDILSPSSELWMPTMHANICTRISPTTKRDMIDAYLQLKRCEKELTLLQDDMNNVLLYWKSQENQLEASLQKLANETDQDVYKSGCVCLLKKHLLEVHLYLVKCITAFSSIIALPESSAWI